jgi:hypothetical protein
MSVDPQHAEQEGAGEARHDLGESEGRHHRDRDGDGDASPVRLNRHWFGIITNGFAAADSGQVLSPCR